MPRNQSLRTASKTAIKRVLSVGFTLARRFLVRYPGFKEYLMRTTGLVSSYVRSNEGYPKWIQEHYPDTIDAVELRQKAADLAYRPLISILLPTYNTDELFLRDCLNSVLAQAYENWELCIVDDASPNEKVRAIIKKYAASDDRIKYKFLSENQHIAMASNQAASQASGEFISLLDHDDIIWPNALYEVVKALNDNRKLDFLYSDEDKITEDRHRHLGYFFKPDWNPDFLHSVNYITHFATIRRTLFDDLGGFRSECDGAQDWDLFLRITRTTQQIRHIPTIVYSWRVHSQSTAYSTDTKPYVVAAQHRALTDDLTAKGYPDAIVERDKTHRGYWNVSYPVKGTPLISIVIPSKNQFRVVKRCIDSIYKKSTYRNFEVILVDTGSTDPKVLEWYQKLQSDHDNFKLIDWPEQPFSYSRSCNAGARAAQGELLVMLNNDTEVVTRNWLELMGGDAQRQEIGAVGCLLFYPDGHNIQHAGVGIGLGGTAANSFSMMTLTQPMSQTQHLMINTKHNMTAVTAACLMIRKELFQSIGGFDDKLRVTYNDVDLSLRLYDQGFQNLYTPHVRLIHHESISVGMPDELKKRDTAEFKAAQKLFQTRWSKYIAHDPNLNPNLSKNDAFYDL